MSFQPFPRTWYSSIPRTIAADWLLVYAFEPAVWWTTANETARAYRGAPRVISSFAPHARRSTIFGVPVIAVVRSGVLSTGLQTYQARSLRTSPTTR